jgi:hypothetical protein
MRSRIGITSLALAAVLSLVMAGPSTAGIFTVSPLTVVSGPSPFAGCSIAGQPGTNFLNSEVEPWVEVNPTDPSNVIGVWQQDRWSNGGARGLVTAVTHDGGASWSTTFPHFSTCAGGTAANGGNYERASDPWVTFSPNGDSYQISLSVNFVQDPVTAILVSKSTDGGDTWTEPITLARDPIGVAPFLFHDKESLTADPTDATGNLVYATWDRFVSPNENVPLPALLNAHAFHQPVWFSRTTNGAANSPTWQTREIFDPGTQNGTISNQIVVTPGGALVDGFYLFETKGKGGTFVAVIRSTDKGVTWSRRAIIVAPDAAIGESDPEPIRCRPFITGNPLCTIVRSDGVIVDLAVDYSTGPHHGRIYIAWQDHDDNPFGDDLIMLSHSDDAGLTWSTPEKVNQTPSNTFTDQAFEPAVDVNSDGIVAVTYYDFRHDVSGDGQLTTNHWIIHSHDGGATWSESGLGGSFDLHQAPYARGYFVGDYQGLDAQGSTFRALFTLASPSAGAFPNPNPTDEFTTTAG